MFNSGLSLTKILGGISKSLTIAEQIIPIYQKISPSISNLRSIVSNFKINNNNNVKQIKTITNNSNSHNPTFFN
jgi:hypothetical protein